ncbi:hypothetical protein ABW21_db0209341 [Orbilia brochopaga]|nr:hypothetical protein ABW21_db0209341 [Drechslerella brochopaga]
MATLTQLHELEDHLDALILSYLSLFDTYQALQADVSKHFSSDDATIGDVKIPAQQSGLRNRKAKATTIIPTSTSTSTTTSEKLSTDAQATESEKAEKQDDKVPTVNRKDPIRWFGILSPPSLKLAQREFIETLPNLAALCSLLREIETQEGEVRGLRDRVRQMRDELGVVADLPEGDGET